MMNPWVKRKWVKALRSGEYGKGTSALGYPSDNQYCCLGVLACEMVPEFIREDNGSDMSIDNSATYLVDDLAIQYDLSYSEQRTLASLNDRSNTFDPVIDYIEENL